MGRNDPLMVAYHDEEWARSLPYDRVSSNG